MKAEVDGEIGKIKGICIIHRSQSVVKMSRLPPAPPVPPLEPAQVVNEMAPGVEQENILRKVPRGVQNARV